MLRNNCVNPVRGGPEVAARLEKCEREKSESGITAPLFGLGTGKPTDVRTGLALAKGGGVSLISANANQNSIAN